MKPISEETTYSTFITAWLPITTVTLIGATFIFLAYFIITRIIKKDKKS